MLPLAITMPWKPSRLVDATAGRHCVVEATATPWKPMPCHTMTCRHQPDGRTKPGKGDGVP
jgi:hypothetical protein